MSSSYTLLGRSPGREAPGGSARLGCGAGCPLEAKHAIFFVAMEVHLRQRCGAHRDGFRPFRAVVEAAECEAPRGPGLGTASGGREGRPGDASFDGPSPVLVARL